MEFPAFRRGLNKLLPCEIWARYLVLVSSYNAPKKSAKFSLHLALTARFREPVFINIQLTTENEPIPPNIA
jgi:hypothetical protein